MWPGRARIVAAGYAMHVILRGIDRSAVFFADEDRQLVPAVAEQPAAQRSRIDGRLVAQLRILNRDRTSQRA